MTHSCENLPATTVAGGNKNGHLVLSNILIAQIIFFLFGSFGVSRLIMNTLFSVVVFVAVVTIAVSVD